eukprot:jgi/Botrbrau1/13213/Bobra.9_1s0005.1
MTAQQAVEEDARRHAETERDAAMAAAEQAQAQFQQASAAAGCAEDRTKRAEADAALARQETEDLEQRAGLAEERLAAMVQELEQSESALLIAASQLETARQERDIAVQESASTASELCALRKTVQQMQEQEAALKSELAAEHAALQRLRGEEAAAQSDLAALKVVLEELRLQEASVRQEAKEALERVQMLQQQVHQLEAKLGEVGEAADASRLAAEVALSEAEQQCSSLQAQLATCTIELRNACHQLQEVEAEVQQTKSQLASALHQRDDAKARSAELASAAEQHSLLNRQLQESYVAHSSALEKLEEALEVAEVEKAALEKQLAEGVQKWAAADVEARAERSIASSLRQELATLKEQSSLHLAILQRQTLSKEEELKAAREAVRVLAAGAQGLGPGLLGPPPSKDDGLVPVHALCQQLAASQGQVAQLQEVVEKRGEEVKQLSGILAAWEALRLAKDAQIAALSSAVPKPHT